MPGPFYDLSARLKLRLLRGISEAKDIDAGIHALGEDLDAALALGSLLQVPHAANFAAKTGELAIVTATATATLPAAANNAIVGVFSGPGATTTVTAAGGAKIYGDFISAAASITLLPNQHVILQSDGGTWYIIAGEPKRETFYATITKTQAQAEAGFELSATRPVLVTTTTSGGVLETTGPGGGGRFPPGTVTFWLQPGGKITGSGPTGSVVCYYMVL
jgi:hypothetical protein